MTVVSVCMPTFNGADYLPEQLETLACQSLPPVELIVCDDASSDRTVSLLYEFARSAPFPVRLIENPVNIGWARTLRRAARRATTDLVAFADQDDKWLPHKLERAVSVFRDHPNCEAVAADSLPFKDGSNTLEHVTIWRHIHRRGTPRPEIRMLANRSFIAMHNLVVRRDSLQRYLWPDRALFPDYWLALIFSARRTLFLIDEVLVHYRLHSRQSVGLIRRGPLTPNVTSWDAAATTLEEFLTFAPRNQLQLEMEVTAILHAHASFLRDRMAYVAAPRVEWPRLVRLLRSPCSYWRFAHGYRSLVADLLALMQAGDTLD